MITVREQPTEPVQPGWIPRSEVKQIVLEALTEQVNSHAIWITEQCDIEQTTRDEAVIAVAETSGACLLADAIIAKLGDA